MQVQHEVWRSDLMAWTDGDQGAHSTLISDKVLSNSTTPAGRGEARSSCPGVVLFPLAQAMGAL